MVNFRYIHWWNRRFWVQRKRNCQSWDWKDRNQRLGSWFDWYVRRWKETSNHSSRARLWRKGCQGRRRQCSNPAKRYYHCRYQDAPKIQQSWQLPWKNLLWFIRLRPLTPKCNKIMCSTDRRIHCFDKTVLLRFQLYSR